MQPKFYFKYKKLIKYVLGLLLIGLTFFVTISLEKSVIKGNDTCKNCKHYSICRSGCRARSLYLFGNLDDIDPLCPLKKNK